MIINKVKKVIQDIESSKMENKIIENKNANANLDSNMKEVKK